MPTATLDTHATIKQLEDAGIDAKQAEAVVAAHQPRGCRPGRPKPIFQPLSANSKLQDIEDRSHHCWSCGPDLSQFLDLDDPIGPRIQYIPVT